MIKHTRPDTDLLGRYGGLEGERGMSVPHVDPVVLLELLPDYVWAKDIQGRYVWVNQALRLRLGQADLIGKTDFDLLPAEAAQSVWKDDQRVLAGQTVSGREEQVLWPDGSRSWVSTRKLPRRDEAGHVVGLLAVRRDVTEARDALQTRHEAQKVEAMVMLAGGIAHDVNNQLTVVQGYCDLLLRGLDPGDPLEGPLTEIRHASWRASKVTRQLLAYSCAQVLHPQEVNLLDLLDRMQGDLERVLGQRVGLAIQVEPDLWPVWADRAGLEQALFDFALYAQASMPQGGTFRIAGGNLKLDGRPGRPFPQTSPGQYVQLELSDTGPDMPPETISRLFDPFFTSRHLGRGNGMGLSTAFGYLRQSGGAIAVASRPGNGTVFRLILPARG